MNFPNFYWAILVIPLVLIPFGVFHIADELSNGQVYIEQDDPIMEDFRQGVFNNTVLMAVSLDVIVFVIWVSVLSLRHSVIEEEAVYNADGKRLE
jgi:hypothetical protein